MAELNPPRTSSQLGLAFSRQPINNVVGDEALEVVATTLTDVAGAEVDASLDLVLANNAVIPDHESGPLAQVAFPETRTDECSTFSH